MQVTVTNYKNSRNGTEVTIDTRDIMNIYDGYGVFDGITRAGWCVLVRENIDLGFKTLFVMDEDVKRLRA